MKKHILKIVLLIGTVLPVMLLTGIVGASAHVLNSDNGITAVLHLPPDDNPKAGGTSELDFSFASVKNNFSLADCSCRVAVISNGTTIQTTAILPALAGASLEGTSSVNFPNIGVYDLIVTGYSKTHNFNSFKLNYLERVAGASSTSAMTNSYGNEVIVIGAGSLVILTMVGYTAIQRNQIYAPTESKVSSKRKHLSSTSPKVKK